MSPADLHVVKTEPKKSRNPAKCKAKTVKKLAAKMSAAKIGIGAIIVALLSVTLWHSSEGVIILTECPVWMGWALALAIDGLYGSIKVAMISHPESDKRIGNALIAGSLGISGYLNALAMSHGHWDYSHLTQIGFGLAIPMGVFGASVFMAKLK